MTKKIIFLVALSIAISAGNAYAHGVTLNAVVEGRVVVLSASYSSDHPLSEALVSVRSPAEPDTEWHTGRTDSNGHFAFVPDTEGEWMVVVDDGKGHKKSTTVAFGPADTNEEETTVDPVPVPDAAGDKGLSVTYRIIIGLSLIIGITGFFYGLKVRQGRKKE